MCTQLDCDQFVFTKKRDIFAIAEGYNYQKFKISKSKIRDYDLTFNYKSKVDSLVRKETYQLECFLQNLNTKCCVFRSKLSKTDVASELRLKTQI